MLGNDEGVTLVELMVAVAIVGLMLGFSSLPITLFSTKMNFDAVAIQTRDALQRARTIARTKKECVTVDVQNGTHQIVVTGYQNPPLGTLCAGALANPDPAQKFAIDPSATLTQFDIGNPFIFNQSGGTDYNKKTTMSVTQGKNTKTYTVTYVLGQIEESQ